MPPWVRTHGAGRTCDPIKSWDIALLSGGLRQALPSLSVHRVMGFKEKGDFPTSSRKAERFTPSPASRPNRGFSRVPLSCGRFFVPAKSNRPSHGRTASRTGPWIGKESVGPATRKRTRVWAETLLTRTPRPHRSPAGKTRPGYDRAFSTIRANMRKPSPCRQSPPSAETDNSPRARLRVHWG